MTSSAMCKGSWAIGSACRTCASCLETAPAHIRTLESRLVSAEGDARMLESAWKRELGRYIAPKRHLIDALVLGTRDLREGAERAARFTAAVERWKADAKVARTLGVAEPSLLDYMPPEAA